MRPLHNRDWGFDTNCFVCEPRNELGLRIPFFSDGDRVVASFSLDVTYSGAPNYAHGGILLAVLDEAMAWATIALAGKIALTKHTSSEFLRPVRLLNEHDVEARVDAIDDTIHTSAMLRDGRGRTCVSAHATFVPLGPAQFRDATGAEPSDAIVSLLADSETEQQLRSGADDSGWDR
jgi:acyl-coenzyme A thioesterase PaaI-like protein